MTDERQSRGAGFWATVALVAVLAYPASMGPACWISSRMGWGAGAVSSVYQPLVHFSANFDVGGGQPWRALTWYSEVASVAGWHWSARYTSHQNDIRHQSISFSWTGNW